MKIAYVLQEGAPDVRERPLTGPANHVYQVFKEFQKLGHDVKALTRWHNQIYRSADLENFEPVSVPRVDAGLFRQFERVIRGVQGRLGLPYANWFESVRFAQACLQEFAGYDLFYERMGWMGYGVGMAARRMGVPHVAEINNGDFITELERLGVAPEGVHRTVAMWLMRRAAHRPDHVVASGEGHRDRFIEWWGVSPDKVSVVENGTELVELLSREQLPCFRELSPDTAAGAAASTAVHFVFVGAFEPWHGILKLIPAMAHVVAAVPHSHLTLIGGGTEYDHIVQLIADYQLGAQVTLTGPLPIPQVAQQLAQADVGLAPYCGWMEFSGLKLFDYKAAGLATVASGANGQPTTLRHKETALIVPPCDEAALSAAMIRLAQEPELRRRMGQAARLEAEKYHSWQHTAEEIIAIFEKLSDRLQIS
jgi:glycosyltransferase involved in cell wall biosynthesis